MSANKHKWTLVYDWIVEIRVFCFLTVALLLSGCTQIPNGIQPVDNFEIDQYLGTWYEIARLDHHFEKDLNSVTAHYTLQDDGGIKVINRGFSTREKVWKEAEGRAYFVDDKKKGHLKVSFFGPFYSAYVIFELDKADYQYAFISGYKRDYLWLLARTPTVSKEIVDQFIQSSHAFGFDTKEIIFVDQGQSGSR